MAYANQEARLTSQQRKFVDAIISGKPIGKAYEAAGYKKHAGNASRMSGLEKVQAQIRQTQLKLAAKAEHTAATIALELDEVRLLAIEDKQYAAAVAAILGKAKVLGLIVDRKEVEILHRPALLPTKTLELSEEEWRRQFTMPIEDLTQVQSLTQKAAAAGEAAGAVARDVGIGQADLKRAGLSGAKRRPKVGTKVGTAKRQARKA